MRKRYLPYLLSIVIIALDQISKELIVRLIPENTIGLRCLNDYLWIVHVRNDAVAFSLGYGFPLALKYCLFILVPVLIMVFIAYAVSAKRFDNEMTGLERWCLAGILGGGVGNLIDRIFRHLRVVDWISTATYGFMGMDRWPTYNLADASVVVSVILLILALIASERKKKNE